MIDQLTGDAQFFRNLRQLVLLIPSARSQFRALQTDVATVVFGKESYHQRAGIGPGLASEIAKMLDCETGFFFYFSSYGFF